MNVHDLKSMGKKPRYIPARLYNGFKVSYYNYIDVYKEYPICPVCGEPIEDFYHIGHIVSRFKHGKDDIENYVLVHSYAPCNVGVESIDMTKFDINKTIRLQR